MDGRLRVADKADGERVHDVLRDGPSDLGSEAEEGEERHWMTKDEGTVDEQHHKPQAVVRVLLGERGDQVDHRDGHREQPIHHQQA